MRRISGRDHERRLTATANLAVSLLEQGKHADAAEIQREVLVSLTRLLGADHEKTLITATNMATSLLYCGQKAEGGAAPPQDADFGTARARSGSQVYAVCDSAASCVRSHSAMIISDLGELRTSHRGHCPAQGKCSTSSRPLNLMRFILEHSI